MGYSEFQIRIFSSPLIAKPRLARRAFGSDNRHNVGRILILTRGESKNRIVSYPPSSSGCRSGCIPLAQGATLKTTANAMRAQNSYVSETRDVSGLEAKHDLSGRGCHFEWGATAMALN